MGARDLLAELAGAGLTVAADGDRLVIRPASKLTDDIRAALRKAKPELLALLTHPAARPAPPATDRPYRLAPAALDAAHAQPWDDAAIARFRARAGLLVRRGFGAADAEDLAERLHLRDVGADERRTCAECRNWRGAGAWQCVAWKAAGLAAAGVGRDLAARLQRCAGFRELSPAEGEPFKE